MPAKAVKGTKLGLGAFQKSTGGSDDAALPTAPRGESAGAFSARGSADNWKNDRESFQSSRGGGRGGSRGGFGSGSRGGGSDGGSFGSRRPPRDSEDGGDGGEAENSRADDSAKWRSSGPPARAAYVPPAGRGGRGGSSRFGDSDDGGAAPAFVAGRPRGKYAEGLDGGRSSGGAGRGSGRGGFGSSFSSDRPSRGGFNDRFGDRPSRPPREDDSSAGGEERTGAWRSSGAPVARRPIGGGSSRGGRFGAGDDDSASSRPAHLRGLKDRLAKKATDETTKTSEDGAGDEDADAAPAPTAAKKPAAKKPAAAAAADDETDNADAAADADADADADAAAPAEADADAADEESAPVPAPAKKPAAAAAASTGPKAKVNPFGAARAVAAPELAPIKPRGKPAAAAEPEPEADAEDGGEGEEEPVAKPAPKAAAATARKPAARAAAPEPEYDEGEGEGEGAGGEGEGEGEGEAEAVDEDEEDDDDDDKPKSVWAANISAQKKAAKAAAAKPAAAPAPARTGLYKPRAAAPVQAEEDLTPAEAARRQREAEAAAPKKAVAPAPKRAVAQLRAAPAAAPAAEEAPKKPAPKKPASNPFGAARPVNTKDSEVSAPLVPVKVKGGAAARPIASSAREREPEIRGRYMADDEEEGTGAAGGDGDEGEDAEVEAPRKSAAVAPRKTADKKSAATAESAAPAGRSVKLDASLEKKKFVSAKESKSALDVAIRDETTVDDKQLIDGLSRLSIKKGDTETSARLADVIAKSVIEQKLSLADAVAAAQQNSLGAAGPASALVASVAAIIYRRKGESTLTAYAAASKEQHDVDVYAAVIADLKTSDQKAIDSYLNERKLICLKPVANCTADVVAAFAAGKPVAAILELINKKVGAIGVPYLSIPLAERVAALVTGDAKKADAKSSLDVVDSYVPLFERITRDDRALQVSILNKLMQLVPKDQIKALWLRLSSSKAISAESFLSWQVDDPFKGRDKKNPLNAEEKKQKQHKQDAIIATSSWLVELQEIVRKLNEPEPEEGDEGEDGEGEDGGDDGGDDDEYLQNSNY